MKKTLLLSVMLLLWGLVLCCTPKSGVRGDELMKKAFEAYEEKEDNEALRLLGLYLSEYPDSFHAYQLRSDVYYRQGEYELSINDINRAMALWHEDCNIPLADVYLCRAAAYESLAMYNEAIADCDTIYSLISAGDDIEYIRDVLFTRAGLYSEIGDFDSSDADYRLLLEYDENGLAAWDGIVQNRIHRGDYQGVIDLTDELINEDKFNLRMCYSRIQAFERMGETDSAIEDILFFTGMYKGGNLMDILRQHCNSFPFLEMAMQQDGADKLPDFKKITHVVDIKLSELSGDYEAAIEGYDNFEAVYGFTPAFFYHRGQCLECLGDTVRAKMDYAKMQK